MTLGAKVAMISGNSEADFETSPTSSRKVPYVFNYWFLVVYPEKIDQVYTFIYDNVIHIHLHHSSSITAWIAILNPPRYRRGLVGF